MAIAVTLQQIEGLPAAYPAAPEGLSAAAAALDPVLIWQRIEAYTAHRFTPRPVVWIVEGPGAWAPALVPAAIEAVAVWSESGPDLWEDASAAVAPAPFGLRLPGAGPYRITATVGEAGAVVPVPVREAFRRLAEYMATQPGLAGARREAIGDYSYTREPAWLAMALQNSGAGDLLRAWRRA